MYRLLLLAVLVAISLGCTGEELQESPGLVEVEPVITDEDIRVIVSQNEEISSFLAENPDSSHEVILLTPEKIADLAREYPVVYGGLPEKALHRIDYSKDGRGILAIVDMESKMVLKTFRTAGVTLG